MWRKEGWTQEHPLTKEGFAEMAMDFCSRHSFDKPPVARKASFDKAPVPNKIMTESEELQAALRASLNDDDDEVEYLGTADDIEPEPEEPSFLQELLALNVGEEPPSGARIQIRMPDAKRLVRRFSPDDTVKSIYAFCAVRFLVMYVDNVVDCAHILHNWTAIERGSQGWQGVFSHGRLSAQGFVGIHGKYRRELWIGRPSDNSQVEVDNTLKECKEF